MFARSLLAALLILAALPARANDLAGTWLSGDGAVRVRVAPCGAAWCATFLHVSRADGSAIAGERLVFDIHRRGGRWVGTAYDPQRGVTLTAQIESDGDRLQASGCIVGSTLCRTMIWVRP